VKQASAEVAAVKGMLRLQEQRQALMSEQMSQQKVRFFVFGCTLKLDVWLRFVLCARAPNFFLNVFFQKRLLRVVCCVHVSGDSHPSTLPAVMLRPC
jgi:hypothetical protein